MTTRRTFMMTIVTAAFALLTFGAAPALSQETDLAELQKRFKERHGDVQKLKSAGVVGETSEGYLDFVENKSADASKVVDAENADRRKLYAALAEKEGTTPATVAKVNAKRNFERARAGEYLKEEGKWRKKGE